MFWGKRKERLINKPQKNQRLRVTWWSETGEKKATVSASSKFITIAQTGSFACSFLYHARLTNKKTSASIHCNCDGCININHDCHPPNERESRIYWFACWSEQRHFYALCSKTMFMFTSLVSQKTMEEETLLFHLVNYCASLSIVSNIFWGVSPHDNTKMTLRPYSD